MDRGQTDKHRVSSHCSVFCGLWIVRCFTFGVWTQTHRLPVATSSRVRLLLEYMQTRDKMIHVLLTRYAYWSTAYMHACVMCMHMLYARQQALALQV